MEEEKREKGGKRGRESWEDRLNMTQKSGGRESESEVERNMGCE